ncbi:MAG: ATP-binding cassette domain-containing protein [Paramuribaculum sp.]|nr:ATP-binding cassette domain-containing protein [Paramuribaculum sp.]
MDAILELNSSELAYIGRKLVNPHKIIIHPGITVVIGPNGSGKSTLGKIIAKGRNMAMNNIQACKPDFHVRMIEFGDIHTLTDKKVTYHQQRYESSMNDEVLSVRDYFGNICKRERWQELSRILRINDIEDKKINYLSSGETRKLLITHSLSESNPDLLIIDNPFIGLDQHARLALEEMFERLKKEGLSILLLVCDTSDIPKNADYLLPITNLCLGEMIDLKVAGSFNQDVFKTLFVYEINKNNIPLSSTRRVGKKGDVIVEMKNVSVKYGGKPVVKNVDWIIKRGDRWILSGSNGSGKSTLLSLIHADNPQAYSNDVELFGRKRGTGESIWDIKKNIGYISSEMHLYFGGGSETALDVIARGQNDTVGSYIRLTEKQRSNAFRWVELLKLTHLADRRFNTLSDGEQRLILLARAFIKNPDLIILDEPMHGLDEGRKKAVTTIIKALIDKDDSTVVFVTHCPEEVPDNFDKLLHLN